jgi:hypothetical protein
VVGVVLVVVVEVVVEVLLFSYIHKHVPNVAYL